MNESLNSILKLTQKVSEQSALFAKIANISKAHSSFTESFEKTQKIASSLANQPKPYGGSEVISKADYFERTQKLISSFAKQHKFYGGGEPIDVIGDFEIDANRLRVNVDVINSAIKSNSIGLFNSSDIFSVSNSKTLDTLKTFQSVSERNLSVHTAHRDRIAEKLSEALYFPGNFEISYDGFIDYDEYLFSHFAEYLRCEEEIEYESSKIEILKKLYKSIKSGFRKFALNKREFFRKINSFHFKNLDDYHSLPLITSVN